MRVIVVAAVEVEMQLSASKYIFMLLDENFSNLFAQGKNQFY
jgi:hypothetical protein